MKSLEKVEISSFLTERQLRFKPAEANSLGLSRIEKIDFSGFVHISNHKPTRTDMILVKKGDLVISGINAEKGAVSVYEGDGDVLATIHYSSYEVDNSKIDVEYFKWFLQSQSFLNILKEQAGGGIKTELKPKKLLPLKIHLPDIDTQREIVKGIKTVAGEIKELKNINEKNGILCESLRQAILQEAVQGKLVPQDPTDELTSELLKRNKAEKERLIREKKIKQEKPLPPISEDEIPYELPGGWMWVRLNTLCDKIQDGTHHSPNQQYDMKERNRFLYITSKNIKNDGIDLSNVTYIDEPVHRLIYQRCNPERGDVLLIKDGAMTGTVTINNFDEEFSLLSSVALIKPDRYVLYPSYLKYFLRSPIGFKGITGKMSGSAIHRIVLHKIKLCVIALPPINEQKRIVVKVDELMKLCDELEVQIKQSKEDSERLMQEVLQEAFEGKYSEEPRQQVSVA